MDARQQTDMRGSQQRRNELMEHNTFADDLECWWFYKFCVIIVTCT